MVDIYHKSLFKHVHIRSLPSTCISLLFVTGQSNIVMQLHIEIVLNNEYQKTKDDTLPYVFGGALCGSVLFRCSEPLDGYLKLDLEGFFSRQLYRFF